MRKNTITSIFATVATAFFILGAVGCSKKAQMAEIGRLDTLVATWNELTQQEQSERLAEVATPMSDYLYMMGLTDTDLEEGVAILSASAPYKVFYPDVDSVFTDLSPLLTSLGELSANAAKKLPELGPQYYFSVISPFRQQIMTVDSLVFIALNHYLGENYPGYESMPEYVRATKTAEHVPYDVAEALVATAFPYEAAADATTLNRLLYEGALTEAVMTLVGDEASLTEFLGWTDAQMADMEAHETDAWHTIVSRDLLYSTDPSVAARLTVTAPSTPLIAQESPGRVGRFIGYKIVQAYLERHSDTSLQSLLSPDFYNSPRTLIEAGY